MSTTEIDIDAAVCTPYKKSPDLIHSGMLQPLSQQNCCRSVLKKIIKEKPSGGQFHYCQLIVRFSVKYIVTSKTADITFFDTCWKFWALL